MYVYRLDICTLTVYIYLKSSFSFIDAYTSKLPRRRKHKNLEGWGRGRRIYSLIRNPLRTRNVHCKTDVQVRHLCCGDHGLTYSNHALSRSRIPLSLPLRRRERSKDGGRTEEEKSKYPWQSIFPPESYTHLGKNVLSELAWKPLPTQMPSSACLGM